MNSVLHEGVYAMNDKERIKNDETKKELEYLNENKSNIIKAINKSMPGFEKVYKNMYLESFKRVVEQIENFKLKVEIIAKEARENYPLFTGLVTKLKENGWAVPMHWYLDYSKHREFLQMNDDELNRTLLEDLTNNDYANLYILLDYMSDNLEDGYAEEISKIIRILELDIKNFTVAIPFLFTLLDFMITFQMEDGNLKTENYMQNKLVKKYSKNYIEEKGSSEHFNLIYIAAIDLILEQNSYTSFSATPIFNRNFVLHGRIDPSTYTLEDFCKLIVLCSTLSGFQKMKP